MRTERRGSVAVLCVPYGPHTLAAAYATAFLRAWDLRVVPLDFEFAFSQQRPDLWRALRALFNPYNPADLPRVQFVLRAEFLMYSLFESHYARPPQALLPAELELLTHTRPYVLAYARYVTQQDCGTVLVGMVASSLWFTLLLAQAIHCAAPHIRIVLAGPSVQNPELRDWLGTLPFVHALIAAAHPAEQRAALARLFDLKLAETPWNSAAFEALPAPDLRGWPLPGLSVRDYARRPTAGTQQIPIAGSIGCPYRCAFCFESAAPGIVHRPPGQVAAEMALQQLSTGSNLFVFCDPTLNFIDAWLEELTDQMQARHMSGFVTFAHVRLDRMKPALLAALQRAGFLHLNFGLESFHGPLRNRMVKDTLDDDAHIEELIVAALRMGLSLSVNMMSEYDRHDPEAYAAQLSGLSRLQRRIRKQVAEPRIHFIVSRLRMEPHSALYRAQLARHCVPEEMPLPAGIPEAVALAWQPLLRRWDLDYDPQRTHDEYQVLDELAQAGSLGGVRYVADMSLFEPDMLFTPAPNTHLLRGDGDQYYLARDQRLVLRLNDAAEKVWQGIQAGLPLALIEGDAAQEIRPLLCAMLESRCIRPLRQTLPAGLEVSA